jgi:ribosome-binding factor A
MMSTIRQEQVRHLLVEEISRMLLRDLKDPRLGFVTVTDAEVSRDLRHSKVFVTILGSEAEQRAGMEALRRATGFVRGEFARRAHLRIAPEIDFRFDESVERGARIFELLSGLEIGPSDDDGARSGGGGDPERP